MKLSEYKIGDRVKYIFLGNYEGEVTQIHQTWGHEPVLSIRLDKPAPDKFNMGGCDVIALGPNYINPIS